MDPQISTVCYYITYLSQQFISSDSIRNYVSGISFLHKALGKSCPALQSFPVVCILRAVQVALRRHPHQKKPITPKILAKILPLISQLGEAQHAVKLAILLGFFGMLRVSNLAPASPAVFDCTRDITRQDVFVKPPGLVVSLKWTKTIQVMQESPLIPIPAVPHSIVDPVQAFKQLVTHTPTKSVKQPLLTYQVNKTMHVLSAPLLNSILAELITEVGLDHQDYSFHSLRRGGATTAYKAGVSISKVMKHGTWKNTSSFWKYITNKAVLASPVAAALAAAVKK